MHFPEMSSERPAPVDSEATIGGRPAVVRFDKRTNEAAEWVLSWSDDINAQSPDSQWHNIPFQNIIALVLDSSSPSVYSLLYVEENKDASDDKALSPVNFKAKKLSNPPSSLIDELPSPDVGSWVKTRNGGSSEPNLHIIVSTASGTGQSVSVWTKLVKPLLEFCHLVEGTDFALHFTKSERSVSEITTQTLLPLANQGLDQTVIVLSGDGGMVDTINALLANDRNTNYKNPSVVLLPLGTGNALAHSSGITTDNTMGMRTLWIGKPKEVPIFCATFSPGARFVTNEGRDRQELQKIKGIPTAYGAVVASWGLHAALVADSDTVEYRKFGAERFKMAAKEALFPSDGSPCHEYSGKVSVQRKLDKVEEGWQHIPRDTHGYILLTFCKYLEKGFTISPSSQPLDTTMRLVHFGHISGQDAVDIMGKAYAGGTHVTDERVGYEAIEAMRIEFNEKYGHWRRICIDGKIVMVEQDGWVEVRPFNEQGGVLDLVVLR